MEKRTLDAAVVLAEGIAEVILVGNKDEITAKAGSADISKATIIDPANYDKFDELVNTFVELRKAKEVLINSPKQIRAKFYCFCVSKNLT